MEEELEQKFFNYGSILPLTLFIVGLLEIYFFAKEMYGEGFFTMIFAFFVYLLTYFVEKHEDIHLSEFNRLLENYGTFTAFGLSSIVFGIVFYKQEDTFLVLIMVYFFALATILSTARNWITKKTHRNGWPLPFNGVFLPFVYYIYQFYLQNIGESLFIFYFAIVGILATSTYDFVTIRRKEDESIDIEDKEEN